MIRAFKYIAFFGLVSTILLYSGKISSYQGINIPPDTSASVVKLIFIGDIMQHDGQIASAWDDSLKTYSYDSCFKYVAPIIRSADLAMANLEVTLGGPPFKGYPQFSAPDQLIPALINAGIDIVGTANNHSCDRGKNGIERTIYVLDSIGLNHTGTFTNQTSRNEQYPMMVVCNDIKLAFLNYTYGTNGLTVPEPNIVNLIDKDLIESDLKKAAENHPDQTIVFIHWGDEYKSHPNEYQIDIAEHCFRNGADIIIGMHPHVVQKIERKTYPDRSGRQVLVAYSLGNYVSNQRDRYKDGGIMLEIELEKKKNTTKLKSCGYYLTWVHTPMENGKKKYYILPVSAFEQNALLSDSSSLQKMKLFASDSRSLFNSFNLSCPEIVYDIQTNVWQLK